MTALLVLVAFLVVAGLAGNFGFIKDNSDPNVPQPPFMRQP